MLSNSGKSRVEGKTTERIGRYAAVSLASRYEEPAHLIFKASARLPSSMVSWKRHQDGATAKISA